MNKQLSFTAFMSIFYKLFLCTVARKSQVWPLLLSFLIFPFISFGQSADPISLPKVLPASPQAQLFMRYGEIPIDQSTGVPNISIPLYTLKAGKFELPISLSYHAAGNKVKDIASPVGLGWVLNAGGVIVQSLKSEEDTHMGFKYTSVQDLMTGLNLNPDIPNQKLFRYSMFNYFSRGDDISSDRYTFNFNGKTGTFVYDIKTNQIKTIPYEPLKIEKLNRFTISITDTEGIVWVFEQKGTQHSASTGGISAATNEYYLTKIHIPGVGEPIEFIYIQSEEYSLRSMNESVRYGKGTASYRFFGNHEATQRLLRDTVYQNIRQSLTSTTYYRTPLISKITWKNLTLSFDYTNDRLDMMKERLVSMRIESLEDQKLIQFTNSEYLGADTTNYRMLLTRLNLQGKVYSFSYDVTPLPRYESTHYHEDFWGYYNGESSYQIPYIWTDTAPFGPAVRSYSNSREPSLQFTSAGIIRTITYPTGGTNTFEFELNEGRNVYTLPEKPDVINKFGGLRLKKITTHDNNQKVEARLYKYENGYTTSTITPEHFLQERPVFYVPTISSSLVGFNPDLIDIFVNEYASEGINGYPVSDYSGVGFYEKVTEYLDDQEGVSGKTEFYFSNEGTRDPLNVMFLDKGSCKPHLFKKSDFLLRDGEYHLVKELSQIYKRIEVPPFTSAIKVSAGDKITEPYPILPDDIPMIYYIVALRSKGFDFNANFDVAEVYSDASFYVLEEKSETSYSTEGSSTQKIRYGYDPSYRILTANEIWMEHSDGKESRQVFKYPFDFVGNPVLSEMVSRNMLSSVVESITYKEQSILEKTFNEYRIDGGNVVLGGISRAYGNNPYENRMDFIRYDHEGNLLELKKDEGQKISYLWSYNGEFPIAEIIGAGYNEVENVLGSVAIASLRSSNPSKQAIQQLITNLNTQLPSAHIKSVAYKPLKGIARSIDVRGLHQDFEYDILHNLTETADFEGNILNKYTYNFVDPPPVITYYSAARSAIFTRNNCPVGYVGGEISYAMSAGTYTSKLSQQDADQKAEAAFFHLGQLAANNSASCTVPNTGNTIQIIVNNNNSSMRTVVLRVNNQVIGGSVVIPSGDFGTFSVPISSTANVSLQIISGPMTVLATVFSSHGSGQGFLYPPNLVMFNNLNFSVVDTYYVDLM